MEHVNRMSTGRIPKQILHHQSRGQSWSDVQWWDGRKISDCNRPSGL